MQISSGCVYDQNSRPNCEDDWISSHCHYVVSKIAGENFCDWGRDLILRPRLYFGETTDKNNLLNKLPNFTRHLTELNSYTSVQTIVEATGALLEAQQVGTFNVAQEGYANILQIAKEIGLSQQEKIDGVELQKIQKLALVNNTLNIDKLKKFYQPNPLLLEITNSWNQLTK